MMVVVKPLTCDNVKEEEEQQLWQLFLDPKHEDGTDVDYVTPVEPVTWRDLWAAIPSFANMCYGRRTL